MMRRKQWWWGLACCIFAVCLVPVNNVASEQLTVMGMDFGPYSYEEDGVVKGFSVEIAHEIFKRVGFSSEIRIYPLSRASKMLLENDDHVLVARLRTPNRETLSKWVGPLADFKMVLYAKKGSGVEVTDLESAKRYTVGASVNSGGHKLLLKHEFSDIDAMPGGTRNVLKLMHGRVDLWMTAELIGRYSAEREGFDPDLLELVYAFQPVRELYIAFSKNVSDDVIEKWQKALDDMKADGTYDEIASHYWNITKE